MTALRIQLRRSKGWRMPPNTVSAARPGRWGNPFRIGHQICSGSGLEFKQVPVATREDAVAAFAKMTELKERNYPSNAEITEALAGKNIACWCGLCAVHQDGKPLNVGCEDCESCHVDILGQLANGLGE